VRLVDLNRAGVHYWLAGKAQILTEKPYFRAIRQRGFVLRQPPGTVQRYSLCGRLFRPRRAGDM